MERIETMEQESEARAEPGDWLRTVRQSLPRALRIARAMRPTWDLRSLDEIDAGFVGREGITGLLWDVDGTLTHYHGQSLAPEADARVTPLFRMAGLRHAIVSNCDDRRLIELAAMFPEIPVLKVYESGGARFGRRLLRGNDAWFELAEEGGHPVTRTVPRPASRRVPVRKPSADIIRFAVNQLELEPSAVAMVGDQYWTDVAGANLGGVRSIRIPTVGRATFPPVLRWLQRVEGWMRHVLA
jgi:predicted HAD superfamily phosphohydrolase YqeG